jgi:CHAT domain-containing protein/tetratricopeptide (TPR) repeat protein
MNKKRFFKLELSAIFALLDRRKKSLFRLLSLILLGFFLSIGISPVFSQTAQQLVQQAQADKQAGRLIEAQTRLQEALKRFEAQGQGNSRNAAITLTNLGRLQLTTGKPEAALTSWQQASRIYEQLADSEGIKRSKVYQGQALQELGLYPRACNTLIEALGLSPLNCGSLSVTRLKESDRLSVNNLNPVQIEGWRSLGDVLRAIGLVNESLFILETLTQLPASEAKAAILLSLGNTYRAIGNQLRDRQSPPKYDYMPWRCEEEQAIPDEILKTYQKADLAYLQIIREYQPSTTRTFAQINHLSLLSEVGEKLATNPATEIEFDRLPSSRAKVYAEIKVAKSQACLAQLTGGSPNWQETAKKLKIAAKEAEKIGDRFAQSFSLGNLGGLYEYQAWRSGQNSQAQTYQKEAQKFTQAALYLAQPSEAPYIAYQWQWQQGRLYDLARERKNAIAAYENAAKTLAAVREDLLAVNSDVQFSFRDNVEPLYRELVALLLSSKEKQLEQQTLRKSLNYMESLQLAELENYLQCDLSQPQTVDVVDREAAVIHPILLRDRLEIILSIPNEPLRHYTASDSSQTQVEAITNQLRQELILPGERSAIPKLASQVYRWLVSPLEADLKQKRQVPINTLVFVLDGSLRNLPMGSLYDEKAKKFLLEEYAIAVNPGLQLLSPKPLQRGRINLLAAGVSDSVTVEDKSFPSIPFVEQELTSIRKNLPSQLLLNRTFTENNLKQEIETETFSIVHLATHGQFSSNPNDTFILTYDQLLRGQELRDLLAGSREKQLNPDLLVLSACETAQGDRRAVLGLAGIAVSSGASSTLATLWPVDDQSTSQLMVRFYQELENNPQLSKAKALQNAQIKIFKEKPDPFYWASFVLVGNWL